MSNEGGEGLYLYLGAMSYPSWMSYKCQHPREIDKVKEKSLLEFW
jgi:hypothetical protein